ncbi:MAG: hypothetical protein AB1547_06670 [Thermodesulfobacteriota bacterium]
MLNRILHLWPFRKMKEALRRRLVLQAMHLAEVTPVGFVPVDTCGNRLNLLLPSINREDVYGGIATALHLWERITAEAPSDLRFRIVLFDRSPEREALERFPRYRSEKDEPSARFHWVDLTHPSDRWVGLGSGDRCIATSWWTAYIGMRLMQEQCRFFGMPAVSCAYLIQDFEPAFYNWSSRYALAESTYRTSDVPQDPALRTWALFNTHLLQDYFHRNGYRFWKESVVSPRMHPGLRSRLSADGSPPKTTRSRTIVVYGRPGVPRNGFEILLEGLRIWAERHADRCRSWRAVSAGEPHPDYPLGNGLLLRSLGKLTIDGYAQLLSESAVGISLMISPHPSYPPLEMAHFGLLTLTNGFADKDLSSWHDNIHSLGRTTPEALAEMLETIVERFETHPRIGMTGETHVPEYVSEADPFPFCSDLVQHLFAPPNPSHS